MTGRGWCFVGKNGRGDWENLFEKDFDVEFAQCRWQCASGCHNHVESCVVGVLAAMTVPLAEAGVSVCAVSTFDTG